MSYAERVSPEPDPPKDLSAHTAPTAGSASGRVGDQKTSTGLSVQLDLGPTPGGASFTPRRSVLARSGSDQDSQMAARGRSEDSKPIEVNANSLRSTGLPTAF